MAERVASAAAAKCLARPRLRERPGSPRLGGDHAETLAMLLIRSVAVIRMVPRIICVARSPGGQIPPPVRVKRAVELVAACSTPDLRSSTCIFRSRTSARTSLRAHTLVNRLSLIVGGYQNGRALPVRENLQEICKEIQDGLEVGLKPGISSAAKHLRPHVAAV